MNNRIKCVIFDCDGVLVDSVSSWRTLHSFFGTQNHDLLEKFISGEITDQEFMSLDIKMWKDVQPKIHQDDLFRAYAGIKLMPGARETVSELISKGIFVAIVSAGVDIFVSTIAGTLKVDDWIANGFHFDDDGYLLDDGVVRVRGQGKDKIINKLIQMNNFEPKEVLSIGDSDIDLSMYIEGSTFIGFNPSRENSREAFRNAGVPIIEEKDLRLILPYVFD
ncbi:MAG: hypothetical protein CMA34_04805 [Euryarchaeota archaeon]|jgi:HAD superfamily PSPase-like hydrolase|nr:hypothetical protein [Euryarchaeota archaeon]|tara:strand:+ start:1103 stop:1765 length:663 start_codon:yes stop_codon:yes gene_type:complete